MKFSICIYMYGWIIYTLYSVPCPKQLILKFRYWISNKGRVKLNRLISTDTSLQNCFDLPLLHCCIDLIVLVCLLVVCIDACFICWGTRGHFSSFIVGYILKKDYFHLWKPNQKATDCWVQCCRVENMTVVFARFS